MGVGDDDGGGGEGGDDVYKGRTEPALVSVSDSYSEDDSVSVRDSRPSSSPAYTTTDYCPKGIVNDFDLRRLFYFKPVF